MGLWGCLSILCLPVTVGVAFSCLLLLWGLGVIVGLRVLLVFVEFSRSDLRFGYMFSYLLTLGLDACCSAFLLVLLCRLGLFVLR